MTPRRDHRRPRLRHLGWLLLPWLVACGSKMPDSAAAPQYGSNCVVLSSSAEPLRGEARFVVCEEDLVDEPIWSDPEQSPPPLSETDATLIARTEIGSASPGDWRLEEIRLQRLPFDAADHWVYMTTWSRTAKPGQTRSVPVLLSGRTVPEADAP